MTSADSTAEELMQAGDRLLEAHRPREAQQLYHTALKKNPAGLKASIWARLELTRYESPSRPKLLRIQQAIECEFPGQDAFVTSNLAVWGKTNPFMDDPPFLHLAWKHQHLLPLPNWEWNFQAAVWAVEQTRHLDGDYVELGVFRGHTSIVLAEYFEFAKWDRRLWLYDTFEGIPEDQLNPGWAERNKTAYSAEAYSFEEVRDRFAAFPNIDVIKGRVPEILLERSPERIAFLHMDLNSAVAEIAALDLVFDRIVSGGVILFDDYVWRTSRPQYVAEKLWFADRGLAILPLPTGQGVFVKR